MLMSYYDVNSFPVGTDKLIRKQFIVNSKLNMNHGNRSSSKVLKTVQYLNKYFTETNHH